MSYIDGFLAPILPHVTPEAYRDFAANAAVIFKEHGAIRVVETWEDDVADGKTTDFRRAVNLGEGEKVVFSWIEWPDKAARDTGWTKAMADPRMQPGDTMPFDGPRMVYGGFRVLLDE
jgi:uncharacterized protein YbaA (DUF1428 family)